MRKFILGVLCCFPLTTIAEIKPIDKTNITLLCYDTDTLVKTLNKEFNEFPFFVGDTDDVARSTMSLWMSKTGKSWTIVSTKEELSCIVGSGQNLRLVRYGKNI